jgi:uncharacterized protein (TIGR02996 family)
VADSEREAVAAQIIADPDHTDSYLVLADLLINEGDPRGELIVLQHRVASGPVDRKLRVRAQKLLERAQATLDRAVGTRVSARWQLGYVRSVALEVGPDTATHVQSLFAHPSARFATEVALVERVQLGPTGSRLPAALAALARCAGPSVRTVKIERTIHTAAGRTRWQNERWMQGFTACKHGDQPLPLANLEHLELRGVGLVHELANPHVRTLTLERAATCNAGDWDLPALRSLDWTGYAPRADLEPTDPQVQAHAQGLIRLMQRDLPALRDLTLRGAAPVELLNYGGADRFMRRLERLCLHISALPSPYQLDPGQLTHLTTLIVQVPLDAAIPSEYQRLLPQARWVRSESLDPKLVGLDVKVPRKR